MSGVDPKDLEPTGGWKPEDPSVTAQGLAEYAELKATILREAAILGAVGEQQGTRVRLALACARVSPCIRAAVRSRSRVTAPPYALAALLARECRHMRATRSRDVCVSRFPQARWRPFPPLAAMWPLRTG